MSIFFMFGKYSSEALKGVSAKRTEAVVELIQRHGGSVKSMYTVLGEHDLVFIVDFPSVEEAMITSMGLHKLTGISFTTSPVVDVERFDRMIDKAEEI